MIDPTEKSKRMGVETNVGYRQCLRCVMDTSDPHISFDEHGICNHCRNYELRMASEMFVDEAGQSHLQALLTEIKKSGAKHDYDCIIGLSGGVDSSYVAYLVVKKLGLRPLAVHLDNGWNSELAVSNVENIVKNLQIELHTEVLEWEEFRDLQLSFLKASVPNCEIPTDHAITATLFKMAAKENVRFIISGSNLATESIMPSAWGYDARDWRHIKEIYKKYGTKRLKKFPHFGAFDFVRAIFLRRIKFIPILNFFTYEKSEAVATIKRELGWRNYGRKHGESLFTRYFQEQYLPVKFGFDKRKAHLSSLICSGQISREEAIQALKQVLFDPRELDEQTRFFIKKLNLTPEEFLMIMNNPPKEHSTYASNGWLFSKDSTFYKLGRLIATSRKK